MEVSEIPKAPIEARRSDVKKKFDDELIVMGRIWREIQELSPDAQARVIEWLKSRFGASLNTDQGLRSVAFGDIRSLGPKNIPCQLELCEEGELFDNTVDSDTPSETTQNETQPEEEAEPWHLGTSEV